MIRHLLHVGLADVNKSGYYPLQKYSEHNKSLQFVEIGSICAHDPLNILREASDPLGPNLEHGISSLATPFSLRLQAAMELR